MKFEFTDRIREIAGLANELSSYDRVYKYLCDLTHCDINTIGYYQDHERYSYKGASREALTNSLLWNVYLNWKFYLIFVDGN